MEQQCCRVVRLARLTVQAPRTRSILASGRATLAAAKQRSDAHEHQQRDGYRPKHVHPDQLVAPYDQTDASKDRVYDCRCYCPVTPRVCYGPSPELRFLSNRPRQRLPFPSTRQVSTQATLSGTFCNLLTHWPYLPKHQAAAGGAPVNAPTVATERPSPFTRTEVRYRPVGSAEHDDLCAAPAGLLSASSTSLSSGGGSPSADAHPTP